MSAREAANTAGARGYFNGVTVELTSRDVMLSESTREALLATLREHASGDDELADALCEAFEDIGPSRIILLTLECKALLLQLLEKWSLQVGGDDTRRPGLVELRDALIADLRDT
jgi:hypothetical protein